MSAQDRLDHNSKSLILERTLYLAGGCFLIATIVLAYWDIPLPPITRYLSLALSTTLLLSAQALRRQLISYTLSAYILLLLVAATVFAMSLVSSGFQGPVNSVLLLLPAYAALFLGIRGCVIFSLISTAFLLAAYLMDSMGYLNYSVYPTQQAMGGKLIVFMFALLGVAVASSTYEYNRRRSEAEMEALNRELDAAHRGAEQSLQVKSQFLANISHEVRTPLNGILGMVTLLREGRRSRRRSTFKDH